MYNYNDLVDKTVLVTGASGDIGHAIAANFLSKVASFMHFTARIKRS